MFVFGFWCLFIVIVFFIFFYRFIVIIFFIFFIWLIIISFFVFIVYFFIFFEFFIEIFIFFLSFVYIIVFEFVVGFFIFFAWGAIFLSVCCIVIIYCVRFGWYRGMVVIFRIEFIMIVFRVRLWIFFKFFRVIYSFFLIMWSLNLLKLKSFKL